MNRILPVVFLLMISQYVSAGEPAGPKPAEKQPPGKAAVKNAGANARGGSYRLSKILLPKTHLLTAADVGHDPTAVLLLNSTKKRALALLKQHQVDLSQHDVTKLRIMGSVPANDTLTWAQRRYLGLKNAAPYVVILPRDNAAKNVLPIEVTVTGQGGITQGQVQLAP